MDAVGELFPWVGPPVDEPSLLNGLSPQVLRWGSSILVSRKPRAKRPTASRCRAVKAASRRQGGWWRSQPRQAAHDIVSDAAEASAGRGVRQTGAAGKAWGAFGAATVAMSWSRSNKMSSIASLGNDQRLLEVRLWRAGSYRLVPRVKTVHAISVLVSNRNHQRAIRYFYTLDARAQQTSLWDSGRLGSRSFQSTANARKARKNGYE